MNKGGFSWKRLSGISAAKSRVSRSIGIPLTKSGRQRKIGKAVSGGGCLLLIFVLGLSFISLATIASCNGSPSGASTTPSTSTPAVTPTINDFSASPASVILEGSSTLSWSVSDSKSVEIDQGIGSVSASGSKSVSPTSTITYTLTAKNGDLVSTKSCTVTVDWRNFVCYKTETGEKYHRGDCQYLKDSKIQTSLGAACQEGLGACSVCKPPNCR